VCRSSNLLPYAVQQLLRDLDFDCLRVYPGAQPFICPRQLAHSFCWGLQSNVRFGRLSQDSDLAFCQTLCVDCHLLLLLLICRNAVLPPGGYAPECAQDKQNPQGSSHAVGGAMSRLEGPTLTSSNDPPETPNDG
jgi:hypothetical protein